MMPQATYTFTQDQLERLLSGQEFQATIRVNRDENQEQSRLRTQGRPAGRFSAPNPRSSENGNGHSNGNGHTQKASPTSDSRPTTHTQPGSETYTVKSAAKTLGVHPLTIMRRVKDGTVRGEKRSIGRGRPAWTFTQSDLEKIRQTI